MGTKNQRKNHYLELFVIFWTVMMFLLLGPTVMAYTASNLVSLDTHSTAESFRVVGNQVLSSNGQKYIPEGVSIYGGLEDSNYMANTANITAQIVAAAKYWHANTIRLQIAESHLFTNITPGKIYNDKFLQEIVRQIKLARSYDMAVVLNDQTEFTSKIPGPTVETSEFWGVMGQTFRNQPFVIFDLFNEPRMEGVISTNKQLSYNAINSLFKISGTSGQRRHGAKTNSDKTWGLWQNGGQVNGITYVGMQTLVDQIRDSGVNNLIWVEGPNEARELPGSNHLLKGSNLVYSIHHPNLNNPASWNQIAKLASVRPVVDGEWAQYQSPWTECYSSAYINAPLYLNYLTNHNVGIIAWSLQAGSLVQNNARKTPKNTNTRTDPKNAADLQYPSKILPSYSCGGGFNQGVGQLLQNYFAQNSIKI